MLLTETPQITLEQAKHLVSLLEKGDSEGAQEFFYELSEKDHSELFAEIGKLTRQLHSSLQNFQLNPKISNLANEDIPDAKERLNYVMSMTEEAANKTMDAIEFSFPLIEQLNKDIEEIKPQFNRLISRDLNIGEFKQLCYKLNKFITSAETDASEIQRLMNEILLAQGFQDLTGQVIRRVIELVREVEDSLIYLLTVFGDSSNIPQSEQDTSQKVTQSNQGSEPEGPIMNPDDREDVVSGQDDVDDLLSSLGF